MNWLKDMLSDNTCTVSSKRVVTFLAFIMCSIAFIAMVIGHPIDIKIFDSMMYIVVAGLGFTASEKFASTKETK